jgi:hypothetical protein
MYMRVLEFGVVALYFVEYLLPIESGSINYYLRNTAISSFLQYRRSGRRSPGTHNRYGPLHPSLSFLPSTDVHCQLTLPPGTELTVNVRTFVLWQQERQGDQTQLYQASDHCSNGEGRGLTLHPC